tara:strand:- start:1523 stop:1996 length:474 start_codon:yes stop_codon:yes gene_type:complete
MIFESIAAITAALSAVNGLIGQVKESGGHINTVLDRMQAINSGMQRIEIEKRESMVAPMTPQEAMKLSMAKQQMNRFHDELRNMAILSRDHQKFVDEYFRIMEESRKQHELSVKAIIAKKKARKALLHDLFVYSVVGGIGLIIAAVVIALVIAFFRP